MRIVVPILVLLMAGAALSAFLWQQRHRTDHQEALDVARDSLARLEQEIRFRAALKDAEVNGRGWPVTVDPAWFKNGAPQNPLVPVDRPWLEIASPIESDLTDPPVRQSVDRTIAAFWYNPANGVVRGRVGLAVTDRTALETYNRLNRSTVAELFDTRWDPVAVQAERDALEAAQKESTASRKEPTGPVVIVRTQPAPASDEEHAAHPDQP